MPVLSEFLDTAENTRALTVELSGNSRALLFSALASISPWWQWTTPEGLTDAEKDAIDEIIGATTRELQTEAVMMPIGAIMAYGGTVAPTGYRLCQGQVLLRATNAELFAVIGTAYNTGGEPSNAFRLPDARGRSFIGAGTGGGLTFRTLGENGGAEFHTLTEAEMPAHTHNYQRATGTRAVQPAGDNVRINQETTTATSSKGSGTQHNNMSPYQAINWIIYTGE
jgi:microcystin-dependent protein